MGPDPTCQDALLFIFYVCVRSLAHRLLWCTLEACALEPREALHLEPLIPSHPSLTLSPHERAPFSHASCNRSCARAAVLLCLSRHCSSLFKPQSSASPYSPTSPLLIPNFPLFSVSGDQEEAFFPKSGCRLRRWILAAKMGLRLHHLVYCGCLHSLFLMLTSPMLVSSQRRKESSPSTELAEVCCDIAAFSRLVR